MKKLSAKQYGYMLLILVILIITAQNIEQVDLNFFAYEFQLPLIVLLGFVFFLGFFTAIIFSKSPKKKLPKEKETAPEIKE